MRLIAILLTVLLLGCGAPAEGPGDTDAEATDARAPAARGGEALPRAAQEAAENRDTGTAKPGRSLATPLPGGVVPDFDHVLIMDMSSRANFTMRQVGIGARDLSVEDAISRLSAQFTAAGFTAGEASEHREARLFGFWKGGGEAKGMVVVSEGGTYVSVIATEKDGAGQARDGFRSLLMITVYTPL